MRPSMQENAVSESYHSPNEWLWVSDVSVYGLMLQQVSNSLVTPDRGQASPSKEHRATSDALLRIEPCPFC